MTLSTRDTQDTSERELTDRLGRRRHRTDSREGSQIGGRYEIRRHLADGGMAKIYVARHLTLGVDVAIKLLPGAELKPHQMERFRREALAAFCPSDTLFGRDLEEGIEGAGKATDLVTGSAEDHQGAVNLPVHHSLFVGAAHRY